MGTVTVRPHIINRATWGRERAIGLRVLSIVFYGEGANEYGEMRMLFYSVILMRFSRSDFGNLAHRSIEREFGNQAHMSKRRTEFGNLAHMKRKNNLYS